MLAARFGYLCDTMGEGPGLSSSNQGNGLLSERNRPAAGSLTCWVFFGGDVPGKPFCSGAVVYTLPKAGAAGSGSSLHWILSKPQDCSKALDWLGYSLVDRPQPAPDSPHYCHNLAEAFPVVILILTVLFPLWLWSRCSSGVLWFPCLGEITVLSIFKVQIWRTELGDLLAPWLLQETLLTLAPAWRALEQPNLCSLLRGFCPPHCPLDDTDWITYLIAVHEDWQGRVSCKRVSLKPWSRILHQQPGLCLGAVTEHKLLFKELAHFATRVKSFGILVQNPLFWDSFPQTEFGFFSV